MSKVKSGRAFEYGMALEIANMIQATLVNDKPMKVAFHYFNHCDDVEKGKISRASKQIALFLTRQEERLAQHKCKIRIQSDMEGARGDVRDIIVDCPDGEVGISAKNRHHAVKHSRLSDKIDFGKLWSGNTSSNEYYHKITPIFSELRRRQKSGQLWRDIEDKSDRFYIPILHAFDKELNRLCNSNESAAKNILQYLLGKYDFYKVAKINGKVVILSFNLYGSLKWGSKIPLPSSLIDTKMKGNTTLTVTFDKGWQLSFRIHNASSKIEPSLKFDIQIVGLPYALTRHETDY